MLVSSSFFLTLCIKGYLFLIKYLFPTGREHNFLFDPTYNTTINYLYLYIYVSIMMTYSYVLREILFSLEIFINFKQSLWLCVFSCYFYSLLEMHLSSTTQRHAQPVLLKQLTSKSMISSRIFAVYHVPFFFCFYIKTKHVALALFLNQLISEPLLVTASG